MVCSRCQALGVTNRQLCITGVDAGQKKGRKGDCGQGDTEINIPMKPLIRFWNPDPSLRNNYCVIAPPRPGEPHQKTDPFLFTTLGSVRHGGYVGSVRHGGWGCEAWG